MVADATVSHRVIAMAGSTPGSPTFHLGARSVALGNGTGTWIASASGTASPHQNALVLALEHPGGAAVPGLTAAAPSVFTPALVGQLNISEATVTMDAVGQFDNDIHLTPDVAFVGIDGAPGIVMSVSLRFEGDSALSSNSSFVLSSNSSSLSFQARRLLGAAFSFAGGVRISGMPDFKVRTVTWWQPGRQCTRPRLFR